LWLRVESLALRDADFGVKGWGCGGRGWGLTKGLGWPTTGRLEECQK